MKAKNNKSVILSFIWILYLKQQNNILWCFCNLKLENILRSKKTFSCTIFHSKGIVYTAEKIQTKYFVRNYPSWLNYHFSIWELPLEFAVTAINYICGILKKTYSGNCRFLKFITLLPTTRADSIHHLNMRKQSPHKTFKILNS